MKTPAIAAGTVTVMAVAMTCGLAAVRSHHSRQSTMTRTDVLRRAQVWVPTDVPAMDLKRGPAGPGAFAFAATVECSYVDKKLSGQSPKFACRIGRDDEVKVKFGGTNGEVYGEVLASRLLWALGFGADRMYPVNVICRGCPASLGGIARPDGTSRFDPAVVERKLTGREFGHPVKGWRWDELDLVDAQAGGAPRAHVDALKLLAVLIQHTDSKQEQQRIVCLGGDRDRDDCERPFLMISDLGMTFGRANRANVDPPGSVDLAAWRDTRIWLESNRCVGNLPKSFSGTLDNPTIGEEGRRFLAMLLDQLSDAQLRDLFEAARVTVRVREPGKARSGLATVDEWVDAFKAKRADIDERQCAA